MKVKICGITTLADAIAAVDAGADAVGLNFVGGPRRIDAVTAAGILNALPPLVTPVALVRLEAGVIASAVLPVLEEFHVTHLQVYGTVTAEEIESLTLRRYTSMPVLPVRDEQFDAGASEWLRASAIVLDAYDPSREGGTGQSFPWEWLAAAREMGRLQDWPRIVLAGGLRPENVADAVRIVAPYAVDVSSGVEVEGTPGRKDPARMRAFVQAAKTAGNAFTSSRGYD